MASTTLVHYRVIQSKCIFLTIGPPLPADVLAFNSNSDRGWNDPPTLAFAPSGGTATPRKRIDLRKRVAHGCVSGSGAINAGK